MAEGYFVLMHVGISFTAQGWEHAEARAEEIVGMIGIDVLKDTDSPEWVDFKGLKFNWNLHGGPPFESVSP